MIACINTQFTFLLKPTLKIDAVYIGSYKSSYVFVVQLNKDK